MITGEEPSPDPRERVRRLVAESISAGDPTGWFEHLYAEAEKGDAVVPWGGSPNRLLVEWAERTHPHGDGRRAAIVGAGLGDDAEYIAALGFQTLAFDISRTAVRAARRRFPDSPVDYVAADVLHPRPDWRHAFDLVVEIFTLQVLPDPLRRRAIAQIADLVRPAGTLILVARARNEQDELNAEPPWPLTRADVDAFTTSGLDPTTIEDFHPPHEPTVRRFRAEFRRSTVD